MSISLWDKNNKHICNIFSMDGELIFKPETTRFKLKTTSRITLTEKGDYYILESFMKRHSFELRLENKMEITDPYQIAGIIATITTYIKIKEQEAKKGKVKKTLKFDSLALLKNLSETQFNVLYLEEYYGSDLGKTDLDLNFKEDKALRIYNKLNQISGDIKHFQSIIENDIVFLKNKLSKAVAKPSDEGEDSGWEGIEFNDDDDKL